MFRDHSFNIIFTFQLWVTEHTHLLSQRKKRMAVQSPAKISESVLCRCRRKSSEEKLPTMSEDVCRRRKVAEDSEDTCRSEHCSSPPALKAGVIPGLQWIFRSDPPADWTDQD